MPQEPSLESLGSFQARHMRLIGELHLAAGGERWGLSKESFAGGLWRSATKRFGAAPAPAREIEQYLKSLHLKDLALACACSEGIEPAWEFFIGHYRRDLRMAASTMLHGAGPANDARAVELADSLYAELYGVRSGMDRRRNSLFDYFHGRSKLSTWLRVVLAQRHVDLLRASGRTVPLESEKRNERPREPTRSMNSIPSDPERERYLARFDRALSAALADLTPRERMTLACYYVDQLTLAEIGRLLREHESTVSRQLERTRRTLRENVTCALQRETHAGNGRRAEPPLDEAQVELAFQYALEDWPFDLSRALSSAEAAADPPEE